MKTHRHLPLVALLLGVVAIVQPPQLQAQEIEFISVQKAIPVDDPRKPADYVTRLQVCVFDEADNVQLLPRECTLVNAGQKFKWDRRGDKTKFHVRLYDMYRLATACKRMNIPGDVLEVHIAHTPCQISLVTKATDPAPITAPALESALKVCNTSVGERVNFAVAYVVDATADPTPEGDTFVVAEGWFEVRKGDCVDISLSERLKKWRNPARPAGVTITPAFFIYGETAGRLGGLLKRVMEGDESDPRDISVCIDTNKKFESKQGFFAGLPDQKQCAGSNYERVRMARVTRRNDDLSEFHWIF